MKNSHLSIRFACTLAVLLICCFGADAQTRTFVSGLGSDANACTRVSPCRSFQRAHDVVSVGGEVIAVDSAGYGPVTITKSVTILGDGVYAGINTSSGNGVNIATADITVTLRSLTIEGLGSASTGIIAADFTALHVENCIVTGFTNVGILVNPFAAGTREVFIKDSSFRNNGTGMEISKNLSTALLVSVEATRMTNNTLRGLVIHGSGTTLTARGCLSSSNPFGGFQADDQAVLNIESCVSSNNGPGILNTSGTVRVSNSTVTNNTGPGFQNDAGTFQSLGNNTVAGNNGGGVQTTGTITPIAGM